MLTFLAETDHLCQLVVERGDILRGHTDGAQLLLQKKTIFKAIAPESGVVPNGSTKDIRNDTVHHAD